MAKLFVSYSRKDSKAARKLIDAFVAMGQDVWVDWEDIPPAADWLEQIFRGIEGSDAFLFLVSPASIASEVCTVEIGHAAKNNRRIIPIVLRDVDPDITNPIIRKLNWTFIRKGDNFEEGIAKVRVAIELDLPWVEEHNRLQSRALDWHRKKEPSLLLRGRDLRNARQMIEAATSKDPTPTNLQITYILQSSHDERRRTNLWIAAGIAVLIMAALSIFAIVQRNNAVISADEARTNAILANQNEKKASKSAELARNNERDARRAQQQAEAEEARATENEKKAKAQRSAAKAQIFQSRPGELFTSTLLAIDSMQRAPSPEAEEILRENISLLPIPVNQVTQSGRINSMEFSADYKNFVTASADGTACVWKTSNGTKLFCADSPGAANDAVFSPNGELLVAGYDSGVVQIISVESAQVLKEFNYNTPIWNVNIRPDGKLLAITRDDGKITIIDLTTRKENYNLQAFGNLYVSAFSPDGQWIAAGSSEGTITIWNLSNGQVESRSSHRDDVLAIEFSPNSKYLVSGGKDSYAVVTQVLTGKELLRILHEDWVEDIAFSPDSSWFATASDDRRIRIWDLAKGTEKLRLLQDSFVTEVKVSSNGQWIATTGYDNTVRVWNAVTGSQIFQIPLTGSGVRLAFGRDDGILVSSDDNGETRIWDISVMPNPSSLVQFRDFTWNVEFSPSGDRVAASDANRIWLLDPGQLSTLTTRPTGDPALTLRGNIYDLAFSPDSKWLGVSSDLESEYLLYNVKTREVIRFQPSGSVYNFAFSPDSNSFITGDTEGVLQTWKTASGKLMHEYAVGGEVLSMAVSPNLLAVGTNDKISILDTNAEEKIADIDAPGGNRLLAFNSDGTYLASINDSGQVTIWKDENGGFTKIQSGNKETAYSMTFNPRQDMLAIGSVNNVFLIDPLTGKEIARIPHKDFVYGVSFSPDGNTLATASLRVAQFWDITKLESIPSEDLVKTACARLIVNFTQAQWIAHFGDEPYRTLCEKLPVP